MYCRLWQIPRALPVLIPKVLVLTRVLALSGSDGDPAQVPEAPEPLDPPLAKVAPHLEAHVAHHQAHHDGGDDRGEDQQEPVEVAAHGHRPAQPGGPGCGALLLDTAPPEVPHTPLGTAPVGAEPAAGRELGEGVRAVDRLELPRNPQDELGQEAAQGHQMDQHIALLQITNCKSCFKLYRILKIVSKL